MCNKSACRIQRQAIQSFSHLISSVVWKINLSGITLAKRSQSELNFYKCTGQRAATFKIFRGAIGPVGENGGLRQVLHSQFFVSNMRWLFVNFPVTVFHKHGHDMWIHVRSKIYKNVQFRFICPKTWKLKGSNRYVPVTSLQPRGRTVERHHWLHVIVQGPASLQGWSTFLYNIWYESYGDIKVPQFSHFCLFTQTKCLNSNFCTLPTVYGFQCRMLAVISSSSGRSKVVPFISEFFLRLVVQELWITKVAQISFCT